VTETKIFKKDETPVRRQPNGTVSMPIVNKDTCGSNLTIGTVTFPSGHAVEMHRHNCNEMVMVLAGDCDVEIDGVRTALKPLDSVHVQMGTWHRFLSTGPTPFTLLTVYDHEKVERVFKETGKVVVGH
jgi:quercetin dioxygenase-like cupin family protein